MRMFKDENDAGYVAWLSSHPDGFVVNAHSNPIPSYLRLHRASCYTISKGTFRGRSWTEVGFLKACAQNPSELERWARESVGGELDPCKKCNPP
jgi:hypothetical protein